MVGCPLKYDIAAEDDAVYDYGILYCNIVTSKTLVHVDWADYSERLEIPGCFCLSCSSQCRPCPSRRRSRLHASGWAHCAMHYLTTVRPWFSVKWNICKNVLEQSTSRGYAMDVKCCKKYFVLHVTTVLLISVTPSPCPSLSIHVHVRSFLSCPSIFSPGLTVVSLKNSGLEHSSYPFSFLYSALFRPFRN